MLLLSIDGDKLKDSNNKSLRNLGKSNFLICEKSYIQCCQDVFWPRNFIVEEATKSYLLLTDLSDKGEHSQWFCKKNI